ELGVVHADGGGSCRAVPARAIDQRQAREGEAEPQSAVRDVTLLTIACFSLVERVTSAISIAGTPPSVAEVLRARTLQPCAPTQRRDGYWSAGSEAAKRDACQIDVFRS